MRSLLLRSALSLMLVLPALAADPRLLALLPGESEAVMGINVQAVFKSTIGQEIAKSSQSQSKDLEEFTAMTGVDLKNDIHEVMLAGFSLTPGSGAKGTAKGLALIRGNFQPARIGTAILAKGGTKASFQGKDIWYPQSIGKTSAVTGQEKDVMTFVDSTLAVAGPESQVKRFLSGGHPKAQASLQSKVNAASNRYDIWMVSNVSPAQLAGAMDVAGGTPEQAIGPMQGDMFKKIESTQGGIKFGPTIHFGMEMEAITPEDATALLNVMQFFQSMMAGSAQSKNGSSSGMPAGLQSMLSGVKMRSQAKTVSIEWDVPEATALEFIRSSAAKKRAEPASSPQKEEEIIVIQ